MAVRGYKINHSMIEKIGTIKNPLTIIAIFAAIAEISGTVVLPFISESNQGTYIWFLMVFPFVLVAAFFLTLNFNHKVLYAPSDYKNEENFIKSLPTATFVEKVRKIEQEIEDIEENSSPDEAGPGGSEKDGVSYKNLVRRSVQASYMLAEELIFTKLQREFSAEIKREVKALPGDRGRGYIYDGVVSEKDSTTIIEVKFVRNGPIHRLQDTINRIEGSLATMPESMRRNTKLLLAVATDQNDASIDRLYKQVELLKKKTPMPIEVRLYRLEDLEKEFEINP